MHSREELLDELARVFARAAVDRYLREQEHEAQKNTPAEGGTSAGVRASGKGDTDNDYNPAVRSEPTTSPR